MALLLWGPAFAVPVEMAGSDSYSPLYDLLYDLLNGLPRVATAISLLLAVGEGLWLNMLLYDRKLIPQNTLLPMLVYVTAMGGVPGGQTLTPMVTVNLFAIIAISQLLPHGGLTIELNRILGASTSVALASLCYLPSLLMLLPVLIIFTIYKMYRWRDWTALLLGLLAPYIVVGTCHYMTERMYYVQYRMRYELANIGFEWDWTNTFGTYASVALAVFFLLGVMATANYFADQMTLTRKNANSVLMMALGGVAMMMYSRFMPFDMQLVAPTMALGCTTFVLPQHRRDWVFGLVLLTFLIVSLLNAYIA